MHIYLLELDNGKYYVGRTNNLTNRIEQHKNGIGSEWTKKYKFSCLLDTIETTDPYDEDKYVKKYMHLYGIDNVRGGSYSMEILYENTIKFIQTEIKGAEDQCFKCGGAHYANNCFIEKSNEYHEKFYKKFDSLKNDSDRLKFMYLSKTNGIDFSTESQPEAILGNFHYDVEYNDQTIDENTIAKAFVNCYGTMIICREGTKCSKKPMTIIDCLEDEEQGLHYTYKSNYRMYKLHKALKKMGCLNASHYNETDLYNAYKKDPHYNYPLTPGNSIWDSGFE